MKKNNSELKFSALKIKKIIQENKEIGKIANMAPFVISKSLEYFITEVLGDCARLAKESNSNKVQPHHIKKIIMNNPDFMFLSELVKDIPDEANKKTSRDKKEHSNSNNNNNSNSNIPLKED